VIVEYIIIKITGFDCSWFVF